VFQGCGKGIHGCIPQNGFQSKEALPSRIDGELDQDEGVMSAWLPWWVSSCDRTCEEQKGKLQDWRVVGGGGVLAQCLDLSGG
jgi:hypothetical protein